MFLNDQSKNHHSEPKKTLSKAHLKLSESSFPSSSFFVPKSCEDSRKFLLTQKRYLLKITKNFKNLLGRLFGQISLDQRILLKAHKSEHISDRCNIFSFLSSKTKKSLWEQSRWQRFDRNCWIFAKTFRLFSCWRRQTCQTFSISSKLAKSSRFPHHLASSRLSREECAEIMFALHFSCDTKGRNSKCGNVVLDSDSIFTNGYKLQLVLNLKENLVMLFHYVSLIRIFCRVKVSLIPSNTLYVLIFSIFPFSKSFAFVLRIFFSFLCFFFNFSKHV